MTARTNECWVVATGVSRLGGMVVAARGVGAPVRVVAVGPRMLADAAVAAGADAVTWVDVGDDVPAEAYAPALVALAADAPRAVLSTMRPADRALVGAVAVSLGAVLVPGVLSLSVDGDVVVVDRSDLGGRVVETLVTEAPLVGLFAGEDATAPSPSGAAAVERLEVAATADVRVVKTEPVVGAGAGLAGAERVVAVGRGLRARDDLPLVEHLAATLGAAVGCSMPIADDMGWLAKEQYIGRSGQHISPRLYVAVGISGAPQHLDGVRDAKVVVAVNEDPEAHIFRRADYGIVGDLYDVVPALDAALGAALDTAHDTFRGGGTGQGTSKGESHG